VHIRSLSCFAGSCAANDELRMSSLVIRHSGIDLEL
jgi:hypothetical protein